MAFVGVHPSLSTRNDRVDRILVLDVLAKAVLAALLVHAALLPDLPQYQAKGMGYRLVLYPVALLLVPAVRGLRGDRGRYPALLDLCVVSPFLIDMAGNAAGFYDDVHWWDDAMHVATWIPLVTALGLAVRPWITERHAVAAIALGFGALASIAWEIAEYLTFVADHPVESSSAYRDTIGDVAGSLAGSLLGAAVVAGVLWTADPAGEADR